MFIIDELILLPFVCREFPNREHKRGKRTIIATAFVIFSPQAIIKFDEKNLKLTGRQLIKIVEKTIFESLKINQFNFFCHQ